MGKCSNALFPKVRIRMCFLFYNFLILGHLEDPYAFLTGKPLLRAIRGHRLNSFLSLIFDIMEVQYWGWFQCVSLAYG